METIRLATLEKVNLSEMAESWNRCWHGYSFAPAFSNEYMKFWLELGQVSLENSIAIRFRNTIIGFVLLAASNSEGWIAGTSIDPRYRGKGLFTPLMKAQLEMARSIGLKKIYLEVLSENHAQKVYRSVGFERLRPLNVYRTPGASTAASSPGLMPALKHIALPQYFELRQASWFVPSWQRRQEYLRRYRNMTAWVNSAGTAGVLISGQTKAPLLDVWSANPEGAEEIISALGLERTQGFSLINQPEDWITASLQKRGIKPTVLQYEMCAEML